MATRTISDAGGNWNSTATWVEGVVPVLGDAVVATATSGQLTVNVTNAACTSINFTNYTNTFTISASQTLTVSGSVTFVAGMTVAGTGTLVMNATGTFTSAGKTMTFAVTLGGAATITLADNMTVNGLLSLGSSGNTTTINANTINANGSLTNTGAVVLGTTAIILSGTGTYSQAATGQLRNNLTINTTGTITISGNVYYNTGTLTYTAGTVVTTGSTLNCASSTTFNCSGMDGVTTNRWTNISFGGTSQTYTLSSNLSLSGNLTFSGTTLISIAGAFNVYVGGNLTVTTNATSSSPITLDGTGTWSGAATITTDIAVNTTGTITLSGTVRYQNGTLTYIAGTVVTTGSTLLAANTVTYNTNGSTSPSATTTSSTGINFNNVTFQTAATITNNSNLTVIGTLTINTGNPTINGSTLYLNGNLTTSTSPTGTALFLLQGTGTWSATVASANASVRNNLTINTAGTITFGTNVYYNTGTFTYTAGTVVTTGSTFSTSPISAGANGTYNTNGINFNNVALVGNTTLTLTSNMTVDGLLTLGGASGTTINGSGGTRTVIANNGITITGTTGGTANMRITGGTLSNTAGTLQSNLEFNGTSTVSGTISYSTGTLLYTSGTITTTGSTLSLAATTTFNTNGMSWNNLVIPSGVNASLTSNLTLLGNIQIGNGGLAPNTINGSILYVGGNFTLVGNSGNVYTVSGTTTIVINGTGTFSMTNFIIIDVNFTINTSGTFTLASTLGFRTGTLTYVSGTVVSTGGILYLVGSNIATTVNTGGMTWENVLIAGIAPITLLSDLNANNLAVGFDNAALNNNPGITSVTFTGAFRLNVNSSLFVGNGQYTLSSNASASVTLNLPNPIVVPTLNIRLSSARNTLFQGVSYDTVINNHSVTVLDTISLLITSTGIGFSPTLGGTSEIIMRGDTWLARGATAGSGAIDTTGSSYSYSSPITIDGNLINISTNLTAFPNFIYNTNRTFRYLRGNVKTNMPLSLATGPTLINIHKIAWPSVTIASGITVTMNEFFSGTPARKTTVQPSSTTNYTITFQDAFEKFARNVTISRATLSRPGQLTVLSDKGNRGNNVGVKFAPNQIANGVAKNNPTVTNEGVFGANWLLTDPTLS